MGKKASEIKGVLDPGCSPEKQPHMPERNPKNPLSRPSAAETLRSHGSSGQGKQRRLTGSSHSLPETPRFEQSGDVWSAWSRQTLLRF